MCVVGVGFVGGGGVWLGVEGCNRGTFLRGQGIMETLATRALSSRLALV